MLQNTLIPQHRFYVQRPEFCYPQSCQDPFFVALSVDFFSLYLVDRIYGSCQPYKKNWP